MSDTRNPNPGRGTTATDDLPKGRHKYTYDGPFKALIVGGKSYARGDEVMLDGVTITQLVRYGSRFKAANGNTIRTQEQIDALDNPDTGGGTTGSGTPGTPPTPPTPPAR